MSAFGEVRVKHNATESRYEAVVQGLLCVAEYEVVDGRMIFTRTFVPLKLRGRGLAGKLVRVALTDARAKARKVTPTCSYVARLIDRHAEYRDLIAP